MITSRVALLLAAACCLPTMAGCSLFTRPPEAQDNPSATRMSPTAQATTVAPVTSSAPVVPKPSSSAPAPKTTAVKPPAATLSPAGIGPLAMGEDGSKAKAAGLARWSTDKCPHWEVLSPSGAVVARAAVDNRQESGKVQIIQLPGVPVATDKLATSTGIKLGSTLDAAMKAYPTAKKLPGTVTDFLLVTDGKSDMWIETDRATKAVVMITVVPSDPKRKPDQAPAGWYAAQPVC